MVKFTNQQRLEIIKNYYRNSESVVANFWLNGFVNKQNMCYWSATNPNMLLETPLHPQKVTVWCGFHAGGVIGPYVCQSGGKLGPKNRLL